MSKAQALNKLLIVMALQLTAALRTDGDVGCINAQHVLFSGSNMAYKYHGQRTPSNYKDAGDDWELAGFLSTNLAIE